jgi:hypothetical protein
MGPHWSRSISEGLPKIPSPFVASTSRKRRRGEEPGHAIDDGARRELRDYSGDDASVDVAGDGRGESDDEPTRKSRRIDPSVMLNRMLDLVSEKLAKWFSKCFLLAVEVAAENSRNGSLSDEVDIHSALLHMLHYFQADDMEILQRGWRVLCFCSCSIRPQLPAREDSVEDDVAVIVTVMHKFYDSERVQLLGFRALRAVVSKTDNWKALIRGGVLPALVDAIQNFPAEKIIQGICITFLVMIMRDEGTDARRLMITTGTIPLIVQAVRRFNNDETLSHTGCCALYQLSFGSTRIVLIEHGAIEVLLMAVDRHMRNASIVEISLGALNQLSMENNLGGLGIGLRMIRLMMIYSEKETIQFYCLVLIRAAGRIERISHRPTIPVIISIMRQFEHCSGILFFGCAVLWQLLASDVHNDALDLIILEGGLECIVSAVVNGNAFGIPPVAHLILTHIWENRPPGNEEATRAFGGAEEVISLITGLNPDDNVDEDDDD